MSTRKHSPQAFRLEGVDLCLRRLPRKKGGITKPEPDQYALCLVKRNGSSERLAIMHPWTEDYDAVRKVYDMIHAQMVDDETVEQVAERVRSQSAEKRAQTIARRNGTYTSPADHMLLDMPVLQKHSSLMQFISTMPKQITGTDFIRQEAHRRWWAWFDQTMMAVVVDKWLDKQMRDVRLWVAEWLMVQLEHWDFAGRQEREKVRNAHAGLRAGRITLNQMDQKLQAGMLRLHRLEVQK